MPEVRSCPNCGHPAAGAGARFCGDCGESLSDPDTSLTPTWSWSSPNRPISSNRPVDSKKRAGLVVASVAVIGVVALLALVLVPKSDVKSLAMGTWSCNDGAGARDYIIGDGTYQIANGDRHGTWSLNGTTVTITERDDYSDESLTGTATVNLTSIDPNNPVGASIDYLGDYSRGGHERASGGAHYADGSLTVHIKHNWAYNNSIDDVTCTKR